MVITHFCISLNPCSSRTTVSLETKNFISKHTDKYWYQGSTDRVEHLQKGSLKTFPLRERKSRENFHTENKVKKLFIYVNVASYMKKCMHPLLQYSTKPSLV